MFTAGHPLNFLRFLLGLQAPGEGAQLGTCKAWSVRSARPQREREAASLWSHCPLPRQPGVGFMCKSSLWAAFQAAVPGGPSTPILPPPEGESEIQSGKQRKWEQREGKSFPVKRKEGG